MPKGDFEKIKGKSKNPACESCGANNWQIIEEKDGLEPFLTFMPRNGNVQIPPPGFPLVLLACRTCNFVRVYLSPASFQAD